MNRGELTELHYITPIGNLPSIFQHGLVSKNRSKALGALSIAMQEVQDKRAIKVVPGGRALHDYVNLYICARNPMLYVRLAQRHDICVLSISTDVLDLGSVVVTDQNAASNYVRFSPAPAGLALVDKDRTFAEFWTDDDPVEGFRKKAAKCAEVLVPNTVHPNYIRAAYVCGGVPAKKIQDLGLSLRVVENRPLFFNHF